VPDCNKVPPVGASYQSTVTPTGAVALKVTTPDPHTDPFTGKVGVAGVDEIVAKIGTLADTQVVPILDST
jgi:hypothetical protein